MRGFVFIAAAMFPIIAACAEDNSRVEIPDIKIGDAWSFVASDVSMSRDTIVVDTITSSEIMGVSRKTKFVWGKDLSIMYDDGQTFDPPILPFSFPLTVGKEWGYSYSYTSAQGSAQIKVEAKVVGWESIEVPAGKFRALRIKHDGSWRGQQSNGWLSYTYWYVPSLSYYAKYEFVLYGSNHALYETKTQELTGFSLKR